LLLHLSGKLGRFADKVDRSKKVLKDNDLLDRYAGYGSRAPAMENPPLSDSSNSTNLHLLLLRRFHLSEEARDELLRTLTADVEFLKEHNCMDYRCVAPLHSFFTRWPQLARCHDLS